jgi:hypothetical protein
MMKSNRNIATILDAIFKSFLIRFKSYNFEPKLTIIVPNLN